MKSGPTKSILGKRAPRKRGRILIGVNGGSIAHSIRPIPLGLELQRRGYEVLFAGEGPYLRFVRDAGFVVENMPSLSYDKLLRWQKTEILPLYGWGDFEKLLHAQRDQLEKLKPVLTLFDGPDASFALAANSVNVPVINIANASTFGLAGQTRYVPYRPRLRRWLDDEGKTAKRVDQFLHFGRNIPLYASVLKATWRRRHMNQIGYSHMLMPDLPELFDLPVQIGNKQFVGPMLYEPPSDKPDWWGQLDAEKPLIYVAVGSSGGETGLKIIIQALADQAWQVVLSTGGQKPMAHLPANFLAAPFVPRDLLLQRASLMIFHGGNASTYQALEHGVPMLAIPGHFDQDLMARAIVRKGLGLMMMPHKLDVTKLRALVQRLLSDNSFDQQLRRFQPLVKGTRAAQKVAGIVDEALATHGVN